MKNAWILICAALTCAAADVTVNLPGDGATFATAGLQKAIDEVSASGGGTVIVPPGTYLTGGIYLKDNVTLRLEKGATLLGSTNKLDYAGQKSVISAVDAKNVALEGEGLIDGRGWSAPRKDNSGGRWKIAFFYRCTNVRVEGVTMKDPALWTCHFKECDGVVARRVKIRAHANFNNDGFDIDAKNVLIEDCVIDSEDDAICPKSDNPDYIPENIEVRNCRLSSNCNFIKFGTASHGGFRNCNIHHCTLVRSSANGMHSWNRHVAGVTEDDTGISGIALEIVDGGLMENIHVHDIVMEDGVQTPVFIRLGRRREKNVESYLRNILIENVTAKKTVSHIASSITGVPGLRPKNITLRNFDITVKAGCRRAAARGTVPEAEKLYPENRMFNGHPLPAYGFYVRHADNVAFENVKVRYAGGREERPAVVQDDTTGVTFTNCEFMKPCPPVADDAIVCEGDYRSGHLQGVATDGTHLYWPFTGTIVKTDLAGRVLATTTQVRHQGDLCVVDGMVYIAVNLGRFNQETGAVSEVWSYDAKDLALKRKWKVPELVHGAGGITWHDGKFYVVGGLPKTHTCNYIYEYTPDFTFVKRHVLKTGYTLLGIQTAAFEHGRFLFGCYSSKEAPIRTLSCPPDLSSFEVLQESMDVGVVDLGGQLWVARTRRMENGHYVGWLQKWHGAMP